MLTAVVFSRGAGEDHPVKLPPRGRAVLTARRIPEPVVVLGARVQAARVRVHEELVGVEWAGGFQDPGACDVIMNKG
jgi:hypothetical protein